MTFSDILADVYRNLGEPSSPATATVTRLKAYVNEAMRVMYSDPALAERLIRNVQDVTATMTITSVASQARYVVRDAAAKILSIADRTNDRVLLPMSVQDYREVNPDPSAYTGTPTHYVVIGRVGVHSVPSNASEIFAKSTAAGDTQNITARFIRTGGVRVNLTKALTGTVAVSFDTGFTDVVDVQDVFLSTAAAGTITVHEDSGVGTELASIPIGATRARYTGVYLWPTPSAANTYAVDYRHDISDMTADNDEPLLPSDFHFLLSIYAQWKHLGIKSDDTRAALLEQEWQRGLQRLRYFLSTQNYDIPVAGRQRRHGYSRLGGFYPADTYF